MRAGEKLVEIVIERRDRRAHHQGNQEKESDGDDEAEAGKPGPHHARQRRMRRRLGLPDRVERALHLAEDAGGGDNQRADADHSGEDAGAGIAGAGDHRLQALRALGPDEVAQLIDDGALGCLLAESKARHGDGDDQHGRDRKDRVIGNGGAAAQRLILHEMPAGFLDQQPRRIHSPISPTHP